MNTEDMNYVKQEKNANERVIRTEILLTPILVIGPLFLGLLLIYDWYSRGLIENNPEYVGTLILGIIVLIGNILFDIPFIRSLRELSKKNK
jgi:hypothetical protein